ncbi:MAG: NADH:flavin oxidoreductase [Desulfobacteraceae bacterium]|jgi:2,4-dienoyl-CoA reductase-like NADH-dependent reductase (Old Yellow Enzyme family)
MKTLFDTTQIKSMALRNRIVRSATWEGMCDPEGRPTQKLADCYATLAKGGVGLIISGYTFVSIEGKQFPGKMGIHTDEFAPAYERLAKAAHASDAKIAVQLVHAGGQANPEVSGHASVAPSAVETIQYSTKPEALTIPQIQKIAAAFADGARRAKAWGFDAVQLHGAHGYLINQFLSPLTNRRSDEYGGPIENRCRFALVVYEAVRAAVGDEYPVMIKLNAADNLEGGLSEEDALVAARQLDAAGIDAIEVSSGTPASGAIGPAREKINTPEKEAYNLALASNIKRHISCPVMSVGGFRSFDVAEKAVSQAGVDYIALSRPLIREPDLPSRWQQGGTTPAACVSCNKCFVPGIKEGGIYCVVEKKAQSRRERS